MSEEDETEQRAFMERWSRGGLRSQLWKEYLPKLIGLPLIEGARLRLLVRLNSGRPELRIAFDNLVLALARGDGTGFAQIRNSSGKSKSIGWLLHKLRRCTDEMPSEVCAALQLPGGSPYFEGVRAVMVPRLD